MTKRLDLSPQHARQRCRAPDEYISDSIIQPREGGERAEEMTNDDEFWGKHAAWAPASTQDELADAFERPSVGGSVRTAWRRFTDRGANPTREHGIVRPGSTIADDEYDAVAPTRTTPRVDVPSAHDIDARGPGDVWVDSAAGSTLWSADMFDDLDDERFDDGAQSPTAGKVDDGPGEERRIDPLVARVGAIAVVATLFVPVAMGLTGGSDEGTVQTATSIEVVVTNPLLDGAATFSAEPAVTQADTIGTPESAVADASASTGDDVTDATASASVSPADAPGAPTTDDGTEGATSVGTMARLADADATVDDPAAVSDGADRVERVCAIDYEVVAGDFWIRVADGAGVELDELLEANGASTGTAIFPGSTICLPAGASTPPPPAPDAPATTEAPPTEDTEPPTTTPPATTPPATTPPATTPPVTTPPAGSDATPEQVQQIIRDIWPDELEERAIEIAFRESRHNPTARNFCCHGVFQIYWSVHQGWLGDFGIISANDLYDPVKNTQAAYRLYERSGGWGPWGF